MSLDSAQNELIRRNISAVAEIQQREAARRSRQERIADWITEFSGSMPFVYIHAAWFAVWILLNVGLFHVPHLTDFDPFPFGLLTLIVSLEAIFLSTFVLISQNRLSRLSEQRAELDLQINLLAEHKIAKILEMLDSMAQQLGTMNKRFEGRADPDVEALKQSADPQEVLSVMEEVVKEEAASVKREIDELTGEVENVGQEVERVDRKLDVVVEDVREIKGEIKADK